MIIENPPILRRDDDAGNIADLRAYLVRLAQMLSRTLDKAPESKTVTDADQAELNLLTAVNRIYPKGTVIFNIYSGFDPNYAIPGTTWESYESEDLPEGLYSWKRTN